MSVFWGMLAYSVIVLGLVVSLSMKLALLFKERGEQRRKTDELKRQFKDSISALEGLEGTLNRCKKEIEVLNDELEKSDCDLSADGVVERLERLLSGEMQEDDSENGEG